MLAQLRGMWREKEEEQNGQEEPQKSTEEGLSKEIETLRQTMIKLEEKDCKHQEDLVKLEELSLAQQNQAQEQMKALTQENIELKGKVASLEEAKGAHEKETSHWKAEYVKQRAATQEEMHQFKVRESRRLKEDYDRWVLKMTEMQKKVAAKDLEISQYREKYNNLQRDFQQVQEKWIKNKGEASKLTMENAQHQEEKVKYKEEVRDLKHEMSAKCTEWGKERNLYTKNITILEDKVASQDRENSSLIMKDIQSQEELAALRTSKEDERRCLIRERDTCQEEADKLKKDKETLKEKMSQLRKERNDYQLTIQELEHRVSQFPELVEKNYKMLQETHQEEAIRLRQERDQYKGEVDELKVREETEVSRLKQERDKYKEEADQLKGRPNNYPEKANELSLSEKKVVELQQERDSMKREIYQLKQKENTRIERGEYKEKAENLKRELTALENQMTAIRRERDIDKWTTQLKQVRDGYEKEVEAAKQREATLENQLKQMRDTSNHETEVVERSRRERDEYRQKVDQLTSKNYELKKQLQEMTRDKDSCKREVERGVREANQLTSKNCELENKLKQVTKDKKDIERQSKAWNECRLMADQLTSKISKIEDQLNQVRYERDMYKDERNSYKEERDKHKQEIDRLKTRQDTEVTQMRQGRDQHQTLAEKLRKQSGAGETGPRERDLSDFLAIPTHSQQRTSGAAEGVDVVMAGPEEGATLGLREEVPVTQGLPNLGNTGYINSVVQCLYHLPPLTNTLATSHHLYQHNQSGMGVASALAQLFVAMQNASDSEVRLSARKLKGVLGSYDATFSGREQQEAHDLFTALVSCLHNDLSQHGSPDTSPSASSLFGGQLETSIVCLQTGAPLTHTSEAFTSLSLPVVEAREWFLMDLLDKHFREQEMDWDCEHCHFTHKCSHSTRIRRCPPLLVIHFSRVAHNNSTRKVKVNFPVSGLDLHRYIAPDARPLPQYQLVGVVCHEGSMAYGHYTAYCRYGSGRRRGRWRLCNDTQVQDVEEWKVLEDESAHMLFYVQQ